MVSIGERHEEIVKNIEKSSYKLDDEEKEKLWMNGNGRTIMLRGGQTIIRLDTKDFATLSHEVFHAVFFLMDKIKIQLTSESEEAFAYAIQFLTNKIIEKWKK